MKESEKNKNHLCRGCSSVVEHVHCIYLKLRLHSTHWLLNHSPSQSISSAPWSVFRTTAMLLVSDLYLPVLWRGVDVGGSLGPVLCPVGWWAEGPVEVHVLCHPPQGLMWVGRAPSPAWRQSLLDPSVLFFHPARQMCPHSIFFFFWFVLPVGAGWSGRVSLPWGSSSSPDRWAWGQDVCEANQAPWLPQAKITTCGSLSECVHPGRGPKGGEGEPRPPGVQHVVCGQAPPF